MGVVVAVEVAVVVLAVVFLFRVVVVVVVKDVFCYFVVLFVVIHFSLFSFICFFANGCQPRVLDCSFILYIFALSMVIFLHAFRSLVVSLLRTPRKPYVFV